MYLLPITAWRFNRDNGKNSKRFVVHCNLDLLIDLRQQGDFAELRFCDGSEYRCSLDDAKSIIAVQSTPSHGAPPPIIKSETDTPPTVEFPMHRRVESPHKGLDWQLNQYASLMNDVAADRRSRC